MYTTQLPNLVTCEFVMRGLGDVGGGNAAASPGKDSVVKID